MSARNARVRTYRAFRAGHPVHVMHVRPLGHVHTCVPTCTGHRPRQVDPTAAIRGIGLGQGRRPEALRFPCIALGLVIGEATISAPPCAADPQGDVRTASLRAGDRPCPVALLPVHGPKGHRRFDHAPSKCC